MLQPGQLPYIYKVNIKVKTKIKNRFKVKTEKRIKNKNQKAIVLSKNSKIIKMGATNTKFLPLVSKIPKASLTKLTKAQQ